jgi:beta-phosphoglucomutase
MLNQYDLFLFDFDGLLVDTEEFHHEAYSGMCRAYGFELPWDFREYCLIAHRGGPSLQNAVYGLFPELKVKQPDWEFLREVKKEIYLEILKSAKLDLLPGVEEMLRTLSAADKKRAVVTHSTKQEIDLIRARLPLLNEIPHWITREDYVKCKPAPDSYLKAMELFGESSHRTIGFEDSERGIQALLSAGCKPIWVLDYNHPEIPALTAKGVSHFTSFHKLLAS